MAAAMLPVCWAMPVCAVGLEGPSGTWWRLSVAAGSGWDNVGGYATSGVGYGELAGRLDARLLGPFVMGFGASYRQDLGEYDYAVGERIDPASSGVAAQVTLGLDLPAFHLSAGPWLYGDGRGGQSFRAGFLYPPFGAVRVRFGRLGGDHVTLQLADAVPFTSEGGASVRLLRHTAVADRTVGAGVYVTPLEFTAGFTAVAAWPAGDVHPARAIRVGGLLGCDLRRGRPELGISLGYVWW